MRERLKKQQTPTSNSLINMTKPTISVVMPLYNIESYLADSIESVIAQTIGFTEHVEIILVDDGSTDGTRVICDEYTARYPKNIYYLHQQNAGVSRARNAGKSVAIGEYIHFFDADDLLPTDFYQKTVAFLRNHESVDFVAAKIKFFDEIIDAHPLNYKFHTTRVIDVVREPDAPLLHVITCVFKKDAVTNVEFDERLKIAEDVKYISDVLLRKKKYGVLADTVYYYRKRSDSVSAIGGKEKNKSYYLDTPKYSYEYMLDGWKSTGSQYTQYTVLYDLSYRLQQQSQAILTTDEVDLYKSHILSIATSCDDDVVINHRFLSRDQKRYILRKKYGDTFESHIAQLDSSLYFDEYKIENVKDARVHLDFLSQTEADSYEIEGYIEGLISAPNISYAVHTTKEPQQLIFYSRAQREQSFLGEVYTHQDCFKITVPLRKGNSLRVSVVSDGLETTLPIRTGPFTHFGALKYTYRRDGDSLLKRTHTAIERQQYTKSAHVKLELRMWAQIAANWRFRTAREQLQKLRSRNLDQLRGKAKLFEILKPLLVIAESMAMIPRALLLRTYYHAARTRKTRPLWIISDRGMAAGDNGEALFRYIMAQEDCPADVYFAIAKKSKDYERIAAIGPVIDQNSLAYKCKFLLADKVISSQADVETTNPYIRQLDHYVDLLRFDFVFLQHGIIRHNLSDWLNRYNKNIRLFITSAQKEYDSIFSNPYYYPEQNILLSGMPRYDLLENSPNKKIILAPTYRKNLAKQKTDKNGNRRYDPTFKASEYRTFYNNLMNDDRLKDAMQRTGMTGEFYLHPVFSSQRQDFDENKNFKVMEFPYDYKQAFREGELLISDHSSVMFDFAYLKKPVAYAHFDVDTFFDNHSYSKSDFFIDEDDGFGRVYYDYETLVDGLIKSIESGCMMPDEYKARVDAFFYKVDKDNSKRVYEAILALK